MLTPSPTVARAVAVMLQLCLAARHLLLLPSSFRAVSYVGVGEIGLCLLALVAAALLIGADTIGVWSYCALVALVHVAGYLETRLVGLPLYRDELGRWLQPRDLLAVFCAMVLLALAAWVLVARVQAPQRVGGHERFATLHRP